MTIFDIASNVRQNGIDLVPATNNEINGVKSLSKKELPQAYIEYLKLMGNGTPNGFLKGQSCFLNEIPNLKEWSNELLDENNFDRKLTENDFVFWMSQGYQFAFFKLDEGDDPPIYYYREGTNQTDFVKITNSFSEFLYRLSINDKFLFDIEKPLN
ncbi:SMI1/KNR4 family protein [Tenacibaculum sp. UWU-22]|uniref:SMI1/KNR4 family protein n=1 Tax=Tenacibaculum sp. UWU-22 TaxID=3234187 RepID=UPI0034DAEC38